MTTSPQIGQLRVADIRDAWANEAHHFTPWLYDNLDRLSESLGIQLVAEGREVAVETFSADILARNVMDDSMVLIENQLEGSDHRHLGQIMTYLAGLDAKTIIWIAIDFRDSHLSAIKWLNEHTAEEFAFFAVRVKVVRIGDSPFAPMFEVLERPNNWERRLQTISSNREEYTERAQQRHAFWSAFIEHVPGELERSGEAKYQPHRWRVLADLHAVIAMYVSESTIGISIRGPRAAPSESLLEQLQLHAPILEQRLEHPMGDNSAYWFWQTRPGDFTDRAQWPDLINWLAEKADLYERTLRDVLGGNA